MVDAEDVQWAWGHVREFHIKVIVDGVDLGDECHRAELYSDGNGIAFCDVYGTGRSGVIREIRGRMEIIRPPSPGHLCAPGPNYDYSSNGLDRIMWETVASRNLNQYRELLEKGKAHRDDEEVERAPEREARIAALIKTLDIKSDERYGQMQKRIPQAYRTMPTRNRKTVKEDQKPPASGTSGQVVFSGVNGVGYVEEFDIEVVACNWGVQRIQHDERTRLVVAGMLLDTALSLGQNEKVLKLHDSQLFKDSGWVYDPNRKAE